LSQAQDEIAIVTVGASGSRMLTDAGARRHRSDRHRFRRRRLSRADGQGQVARRRGNVLPIDLHEVAKLGVPLGSAVQAQGIANGAPILASAASSDITGTDVHP
jgi:hypothetical protein